MINGFERVGIYGGTFSPVHNGHVVAARAFLEQMKLDKVIVGPTFIPPHKEIDASDNPIHRLNMCSIAFSDDAQIEVSDIEIARGGCSYTIDTLRFFQAQNRKLFLLCGTDMMLAFDLWKNVEQIFEICCPVYMRRETDCELDNIIIRKNNEYYQKYGAVFRRIVQDPIPISSTDVRNMIKMEIDIHEYVPGGVADYIKDNNLYVS